MWIGTDDKACCPDQIYSAMWIREYVKEALKTNLKYYVD
jgi:hypothetical protein